MIFWDPSSEDNLRQNWEPANNRWFQLTWRSETCDMKLTKNVANLSFRSGFSSNGLRPIHDEHCQIRDFRSKHSFLKRLRTFFQGTILRITCLIFSIISFSQRLSYCYTDTQSASETLTFATEESEQGSSDRSSLNIWKLYCPGLFSTYFA
jgi:hypothetical protein